MSGDAMTHGVQEIGTTKENLALSADIGTPGYAFFRNLDPTNWVGIGLDGDTPFLKLKAGEERAEAQLQVGRARVGKGGVVRDPAAHIDAMREVCSTWPFDKYTPIALLRDVLHHLEALQQAPVPVSDAPSATNVIEVTRVVVHPEVPSVSADVRSARCGSVKGSAPSPC
jgi:hypothetical protein